METLMELETLPVPAPANDEDRDTSRDVLELEEQLEQEVRDENLGPVEPEDGLSEQTVEEDESPESYRRNSQIEARLLTVAENFQRQFSQLHPDRRPQLLCPLNECGVKKFVSTTLRPTAPTRSELHTWEGCASFVADYLSLKLLEPPEELPRTLFSPTTVLKQQRASCFESSTLLCSLLIGTNYDAYCVSGYASRELCVLDRSLQDCHLLDALSLAEAEQPPGPERRYTVRPQKEMKSRFITQQEEKKEKVEVGREPAEEIHQQVQRIPPDPLHGLRVYSWVLVLSGCQNVQENFFIDPLTGQSFRPTHTGFLGVESVWNHLNYYVNLQDCSTGTVDLQYDLDDLQHWEPIFYDATSKKQLIADFLRKKETERMSKFIKEEEEEEQPRVLQMPRSWVSPFDISQRDLETRWPGGQKTTRYRKADLESFSLYLRPDGLVTRLTTYNDLNWTQVVTVKEWYQHRQDHLEEREVNQAENFVSERFKPGRSFHLLYHKFTAATSQREMNFSEAREDGLIRRVESPREMTETFKGRADYLYYRHVVFDQHPRLPVLFVQGERPLLKVVERFHRDPTKEAKDDVAERTFLVAQRLIEVTYHLEEHRFIPSRRTFIKPRDPTERQKADEFNASMVSSFQVDLSQKPPTTLTLYGMLVDLMADEEDANIQIQAALKEMRELVSCREQEDRDVQLHFCPWTTVGAAKARSHRQEMEIRAEQEQRWLLEMEKDFLAPFLIRLGVDEERLSSSDAKQLHQDCLADCQQRLEEEASLIQERYKKETEELQWKQQWYQKNQLNMTRQQVEEYQAYCSHKTLQIHVAEKRLTAAEDASFQKHSALDQKLKADPRLAHLLVDRKPDQLLLL